MTTARKQTISNPQVSIIPAKKRHLQNGDQFRSQKELRVAAYCRVSTDEASQENSYNAQKNHYTTMIASRPGWQLAGLYADEGKTGTTRRGRIHFNELMADCREGKVDYIITKSISRFARNTVDALECVHELQRLHPPVGVYFERENIDTLNANSEMFLTFYCSMAQEESHSISENIKWSIQKNFRSGKPQINLKRMLGYDMCRDGNWAVNEEESETVRRIYSRFLEGMSANGIARELNETGRKTVNGKDWRADGVLYVLRNEKYAGDIIMQKTYTESFLTHKAVKNTGEVPQYFKQDHHPAIVDRDTWNKVQEVLIYRQRGRTHSVKKIQTDAGELEISIDPQDRTTQETYAMQAEFGASKGCPASPFALMTCACCGKKMRRMSYHAYLKGYKDERSHEGRETPPEETDFVDSYTFSYAVWKCPGSGGKNGEARQECGTKTLPEISIRQSFMEMLYGIRQDLHNRGEQAWIVTDFQGICDALKGQEADGGFIRQKLALLEMEIAELERNHEKTVEHMNAASYAAGLQLGSVAMESGRTIYARLAEDLKKRLEEKRDEKSRLAEESSTAQTLRKNFRAFLAAVEALPDGIRAEDHPGQDAPELFAFDEHIFRTYILRMETLGDEIRFGTSFGLTLTSTGNSRPIKSFVGYRQAEQDGSVRMIARLEQLSTGVIQHHWKPRGKKHGKGKKTASVMDAG